MTLTEKFPPTIDGGKVRYIAYNDDAQVVVTGKTEAEARTRYTSALEAQAAIYGEPPYKIQLYEGNLAT